SGVFNGTDVVIFGGVGVGETPTDVGLYNPVEDKWSTAPAPPAILNGREYPLGLRTGPSGDLATFYGGMPSTGGDRRNHEGPYKGALKTWDEILSSPPDVWPDSMRQSLVAAWAENRIWLWGGSVGGVVKGDGASYDPKTKAWSPMPSGGPSPRMQASMVWTG